MKTRLSDFVRIVTGATLVVLSFRALRGAGWVGWLAAAEIVAALVFCLPRVWPFGGAALLAILSVGFVHHALAGQFAALLVFAAMAVLMVLAHGRR